MATKYTRDSPTAQRITPYERQQAAPIKRSPRQRLLVIYLGLFMVSVFIYFATAIAGQMQFEGRPLERGVGVVESKRVEGDRYLLDIRVPLGAHHAALGEGSLDQEAWDLFTPGDGVGVLYRTNRSRRELKIEEVGLKPVSVPGTLPSVILPPPKASP